MDNVKIEWMKIIRTNIITKIPSVPNNEHQRQGDMKLVLKISKSVYIQDHFKARREDMNFDKIKTRLKSKNSKTKCKRDEISQQ